MVMVQNPEEEAALGPEWSRTPLPSEPPAKDQATALPKEDKPEPEPEEEPEEEPEQEEQPVEEPHPATPPPVRPPVRKTAVRKPAARTKTHKR